MALSLSRARVLPAGEALRPARGGIRRVQRSSRRRDQRGATLIEFALVLPVFTAMMLGTISGGIAYNQKLNLSSGVREGARYGATLPVGGSLDVWLASVAEATEQAAAPDAGPSAAGRYLCVAYVYPAGLSPLDQTRRRTETGSSSSATYTAGQECFSDGLPATTRRVQVLATRQATFQAFFFKRGITIRGQGVSRFEATL